MPRDCDQQLREETRRRHRLESALNAKEQLDAEAAEQRNFLDQLIETLPHAFCYLDRDRVFRRVNPSFARIFGRNVEDFLSKPLAEVFQGTEEPFEALIQGVLVSGSPAHAEAFPFTYSDASGEHPSFWDLVFQPLRAGDGSVMGVAVPAAEVSDRNRMEAILSEQPKAIRQG